ncbi:MAG: ribosome small subunit-dependent GTPase A [Bacilli bacterium]|nr:ribosome small subunit-dependent GTPase A [Bacilli bacterium]
MEGIIIKNQSNDYTVRTKRGINICKPRGKFRLDNITPLVGDIVDIDDINNYILEIKPRKNSLIRPQIANVDIAIIVTSVKEPDFDSNLLDKLLTIISYNNITPVICLTKLDLLNAEELNKVKEISSYYQKIGYNVVTNNDIKEIKKIIENKIIVFAGQSGAGKSSLLNKLDRNLSLETNDISKALGRGKHTTRCVTLYNIDTALVADTPGFSSVDFRDMTKLDIRDNMKEMFDNLDSCKYRDCMHIKEDDCEVRNLVEKGEILESRYNNYKTFIGGK